MAAYQGRAMNNRRKLVIAIGAGALVAPCGSFAQPQTKVWRIGFLTARSRPESLETDYYGGFLRGLRELGYVEGKNLAIEWRFADGKNERLPDLAAELAQMKVDVIVAGGTPATIASQKSTSIIPIVMGNTNDPVGSGFVKSLARPGGNITGLSNVSSELSLKFLEMLRSMVPKVSRVAVLVNPANSANVQTLESIRAAAQKIKINILLGEARTSQDIRNAFSAMTRQGAGAFIVLTDGAFIDQRRQIADLATRNRLPSIASFREYVDVGGLMNYGPNFTDTYRRAAYYVDKIFKGAKPADLPVEQPTIFELFINGKTAKALGLKIPHSLLIMADKVIE
jgi:putative ABC transport system substrate-binding protein